VRGTGDPARYACKVEMVDSRDEIEVGDLLVTSGKGKWFPKGLPVGRVTKVVKRELGRDQEVEAAPSVNFSRLESVLILVTPPSEEEGKTAAGAARLATPEGAKPTAQPGKQP
jgi:rod shape-determining protein MreC